MNAGSQRLRAWIEIARPPNLFTVPGDPLAGFFLAASLTGSALYFNALCAALAALALYVGGLIGNDVADYEEDRRDRPARPLPSGRLSRSAAFAVSALCSALGLVLALRSGTSTFATACLAQVAVMVYNGWLKHYTIPGALCMGACRGFSFLIGADAACPSALPPAPVLMAAAGVTAYVAGVTWIADRETTQERIGPRRWVPFAVLAVYFSAVAALARNPRLPFALLGGIAAGWALHQGARLRGIPAPPVLGSAIGGLIRGLLPAQAALCSLGGAEGLLTAAALLLCWPLSAAVAKRFYAT